MLCGMQTSQRRTFLLLTLVTLPTPINNLIFPFFLSLLFSCCVLLIAWPHPYSLWPAHYRRDKGTEKKLYNNSIDKTLYPGHHRKQQVKYTEYRGGLYLILFG
jgi:hypothetical protein